jgi:hypothetical protein
VAELSHLLRLILLIAAVWLNNGSRHSLVQLLFCLRSTDFALLLHAVFYLAYRIYLETFWGSIDDSLATQVPSLGSTI